MSRRLVVLAAVWALVLAAPGTAAAQGTTLRGSVGPGFTIVLADEGGRTVTTLAPGTYTIIVEDRAAIHNFHLSGPGVDMATGVPFVGTVTWTVTFSNGTYTYVCDPHASEMNGSFTVGTGAPPPPPPAVPPAPPAPPAASRPSPQATPRRLNATVGPGFRISLRTLAGSVVRRVRAGLFTLVVRDRSRIHNFHLVGPGVNRRTGVRFTGTARWRVRFRAGATYRFVCDPHARTMRGTLRSS